MFGSSLSFWYTWRHSFFCSMFAVWLFGSKNYKCTHICPMFYVCYTVCCFGSNCVEVYLVVQSTLFYICVVWCCSNIKYTWGQVVSGSKNVVWCSSNIRRLEGNMSSVLSVLSDSMVLIYSVFLQCCFLFYFRCEYVALPWRFMSLFVWFYYWYRF